VERQKDLESDSSKHTPNFTCSLLQKHCTLYSLPALSDKRQYAWAMQQAWGKKEMPMKFRSENLKETIPLWRHRHVWVG